MDDYVDREMVRAVDKLRKQNYDLKKISLQNEIKFYHAKQTSNFK